MAEYTSVIERIKQKLDIVEEIGAVVALKKSGKSYKGLCPFHSERTPSFYVFPEKSSFHCFGCNENGDIFSFVQKQQSLDFREVLALLADRAQVPLDSGTQGDDQRAESAESAGRRRLRALNEAAAIWFHHQLLQSAEAQYARAYLDSRGVSNESIATWRLGYAPDGDGLSSYLVTSGYALRELVEAGLAREREAERGGGLYDYFRQRVIFPIRDLRGQVIAFGGRELGGGHPKYLNTPQTPLFDKSATLFGLDLARDAIRRADRVIIVEGYLDAIVTHQYGSRNVVACIGSAITDKHVRQIKKMTRRLALALDPDAAGQSATMRGIAVAQAAFDKVVVPVPGPVGGPLTTRRGDVRSMVRFEEQVDAEITVLRLPAGEDPDEFIRRDAAAWQQAIDQALPLVDYLLDAQTADLALDTPAGKAEAAQRVLPLIAEISDRTAQDAYLRRLAARLRVDERELALDFQRVRRQRARNAHPTVERQSTNVPTTPAPSTASTSESSTDDPGEKYHTDRLISQGSLKSTYGAAAMGSGASTGLAARLLAEQAQEEYCLGVLLERPATWTEMRAILVESDFLTTELRALYAALVAALQPAAALDLQGFLEDLPPLLQVAANRARLRVDPSPPVEGAGLMKVARHAAYRLKRTRLKEEMAELDYLERDAEQSGDQDGLRALLGRKQHLLAQRRAIDAAAGLFG
ncbi:MAG TPA: DNA primase [Ktedonobacterales bacterium]|nr:DNA primase [Ktedonobacterales bacterium]